MKSERSSDEIFGVPPQMKLNPPLHPAARQISSRSGFIPSKWDFFRQRRISFKKALAEASAFFYDVWPIYCTLIFQRVEYPLGDDGSCT